MRVMIFDTETGGLDFNKHSLLTIGWVIGDVETGEIFKTVEFHNKLGSVSDYNITEGAYKVHGISAEECMSKGVPTEEIADAMISDFVEFGCQHVGGHNVHFDIAFSSKHIFGFETESQEFNANFTYRHMDSLPVVQLFGGLSNVGAGKTLTQVVKMLKIDMSDHSGSKFHAALYDSICCFRALVKIRDLFRQVKID